MPGGADSMSDKQEIVIFGADKFASLAWYCLTHDSPYRVVGFTVDRDYLHCAEHEGLAVVPFEDIDQHHPPEKVRLLVALGYHAINGLRKDRVAQARKLGYTLVNYVSSRAITWPDLRIGENCLIYEGAVIQPFARIGDGVIIRSNAHVSHHCIVDDHAFIAAGVTLGGRCHVGEQAFIGLGAVVRDGVKIGERSFIGAGAVVLGDTEPDAVYVGNPARRQARSAIEVSGGQSR